MSEGFTLITGRTFEQGKALHQGKGLEPYHRATSLVEMNPQDMAHLGIEEGQTVWVRTAVGQQKFAIRNSQFEIPPGLLFIPLGTAANALVGADTEGTGMPLFKGLAAEVELV
ncbi:MAG: molybdopterin dinucleotide binding domain-containing protein [Chloroflexota bacterium]|nr:molybdopterin dinucleotide binding domain-containing protein [Chloroflexota bacterium]